MNNWIEKLVDVTAIGNDQAALKSGLAHVAERFDFVGYAFVNLRPGDTYAASNYHPEWQTMYDRLGFRFIDPVMRRAQRLRKAFAWSGEQDKGALTREEISFFSQASEFDIRSGISIPVATPNGAMSMLTFVSSKPILSSGTEIDAVAAASAVGQLHARFEYLKVTPSVEKRGYLGPKEAIYVRWLAAGKTVEVTADLEKVKYNTVRIALEEAKRRLDLCNNTQLVAYAIRRGFV